MELNKTNIKVLQSTIDDYDKVIETFIDKQVKNYCKELDRYVTIVSRVLENKDNKSITNEFLEDVTLQLPKLMYWASEGQEILGSKFDIAKNVKNEKFLDNLKLCDKGTVGQRTMEAELKTLEESTLCDIYNRAINKIGLKLKYATELLQSAKKLLSKRMQEFTIDSYSTSDAVFKYSSSKEKNKRI